jgi:hypothetical protein
VGRKRDSNRRSHSRKGRCREVGRASAKTVAPLAGTESANPFLPPVDLSQQVKFSRLQAKGWLSSLVGLLTVGVRPARQEPALDDIRVASQTTSRTRTRASLGNPSAPLRPGIASGSGAYSISP